MKLARWRLRGKAAATEPLRTSLVVWADDAIERLAGAEPDLPDELNDREQDIWEPLFAIADDADGDWPARARRAALDLHGSREDESSEGVLLLAHCRQAFEDHGTDTGVISSEQLVRALTENEQGPWGQLWKLETDSATRSAKSSLAQRLKAFRIRSTMVKVAGKAVRGYRREDFVPQWAKYLSTPGEPDATDATDATSQVGATRDVASVAEVAPPERTMSQEMYAAWEDD